MEIIKNSFNHSELTDISCPHCHSLLRCTYDELENLPCPVCGKSLKDEIEYNILCDHCGNEIYPSRDGVGVYGLYYTICPKCGGHTYIDDGIDVTTENIKPEHFSSFGEYVIHVEFSEIKKWIADGVNYLKRNPSEHMWYRMSGDAFIMITKEEDEFYVAYTSNYKDVYLRE